MSSPVELEALVRRMADGDRKAFAAFYDRTSPIVFGLLMKILADRQRAEDVAQEVYTQMWRTAGSFDPDRGSVRTWIAMAARSRAIDHVRSAGTYADTLDGLTSRDHPRGAPPPNPEQSVSDRERRELVRRALEDLPEEQREAIQVAFFRGWSHREIAEKTDTPLGTVKSRIRSGLMKLEERLSPTLGDG